VCFPDHTFATSMIFVISILLHTETPDGTVVPVWEEVQREDVSVLKDIMTSRREGDASLQYIRLPITAEKPPDYTDLKEFIELALRTPRGTPIVVNCQLGRGRSTLATIILVLLKGWLQLHQPTTTRLNHSISTTLMEPVPAPPARYSYQVINSWWLLYYSHCLLMVYRSTQGHTQRTCCETCCG
jgi:hypothetical protein